MKKEILILFVLVIVIIEGCYQESGEKSTPSIKPKNEIIQSSKFQIYEGIVPCADCEGIKMTLKIANDFQSYELIEEYMGKKGKPFTSKGKLNTERGFENDPDATLFVLNYDQPEENQIYFVRLTNMKDRVTMLAKNRKKITSDLNYTLTKKSDF
ncbi:MAG: copper resistance protein NlpE [Bacteroidota bacterium]